MRFAILQYCACHEKVMPGHTKCCNLYSTLIGPGSCLRTLHDHGYHHKHVAQGIGLTSNHLLQHTKVSSRTYLASLLGSVHIHGSIPALSKPSSQRQAIVDDSTTGFLQAIQRQCDLQVLRFFRETEWRIGATLRIHHASFSTSLAYSFPWI